MSLLKVAYKGSNIIDTSISTSKTIKTSGKYCEDDLSVTVDSAQTIEEKDINFYDYDGTLVESWTLEELQTKTALPDNPTHEGLVAQGWNWTLATLKADNKPVQVGQMYVTDDGKTRLYLYFENGLPSDGRAVNLRINQSVSNGVTIDWGDGSSTETIEGTGYVSSTHSYQSGNYVLTLNPSDDCEMYFGGGDNDNYNIVSSATNYSTFLVKVEIGNNVEQYGRSSFYKCTSIREITTPITITTMNRNAFAYCCGLKCYICSINSTSVGDFFSNGSDLSVLSLSESIISLGNQLTYHNNYHLYKLSTHRVTTVQLRSLQRASSLRQLDLSSISSSIQYLINLYSLQKVIFGSNITSFSSALLTDSPLLNEIHFQAQTPIAITTATSWTSLPSTCKIYVPTGSLSAYQSATNYPDPTVYTYVEE